MLTLAFESSARPASAALVRDGALISQYTQCSGLTHSRTLMPLVDGMLSAAGLRVQDMDLLAAANGPGSFTGIRVGIAAARALGIGWGAPGSLFHGEVSIFGARESLLRLTMSATVFLLMPRSRAIQR